LLDLIVRRQPRTTGCSITPGNALFPTDVVTAASFQRPAASILLAAFHFRLAKNSVSGTANAVCNHYDRTWSLAADRWPLFSDTIHTSINCQRATVE